MPFQKQINVLIFNEEGTWVAQCIDYDIAVQADSLRALEYELQRVLVGRILVAKEVGIEPFAGLPPAPERFRRIFAEEAERLPLEHLPELRPATDTSIPEAYMLPKSQLEVRVA